MTCNDVINVMRVWRRCARIGRSNIGTLILQYGHCWEQGAGVWAASFLLGMMHNMICIEYTRMLRINVSSAAHLCMQIRHDENLLGIQLFESRNSYRNWNRHLNRDLLSIPNWQIKVQPNVKGICRFYSSTIEFLIANGTELDFPSANTFWTASTSKYNLAQTCYRDFHSVINAVRCRIVIHQKMVCEYKLLVAAELLANAAAILIG